MTGGEILNSSFHELIGWKIQVVAVDTKANLERQSRMMSHRTRIAFHLHC